MRRSTRRERHTLTTHHQGRVMVSSYSSPLPTTMMMVERRTLQVLVELLVGMMLIGT